MKSIIPKFFFIQILILTITGLLCTLSYAQQSEPDSLMFKNKNNVHNDSTKAKSKSPKWAMIRSLVIPGWGQFYNNKKFKAALFFCAETALVVNSVYLNQKYKESETELEREYYITNRNISNWWLVGVILISMADAFVDAHLYEFDESADLSFVTINPVFATNNSGVQLSLQIHF
jgi:hypothetical protein